MKRTLLTVAAALIACGPAMAVITVNFSQLPADGIVVEHRIPIEAMAKSRAERRAATMTDTLKVSEGKIILASPTEPSRCTITLADQANVDFFAAPYEDIVIDVRSIEPLDYTMKGTELVEGMQLMSDRTRPIEQKLESLRSQENVDQAESQALIKAYYDVFADYIAANPNSSATPYAALNLEDEALIAAVDSLTEQARKSIIMPYVAARYDYTVKQQEIVKRQAEMQSGNVDAPAFTLKNLDGKDVSLTDFKGKWVILDFWGTWCPWCIKGFPALKDAYSKYAGKLEIVGVDCGDTEDAWRKGVKKYSLPWVQVYNPQDSGVAEKYLVTGFPTKVIVNPQGKIANITVGEDPDFFNVLARLIGE